MIKMIEIRPYSMHKIVHECDEKGVCKDCGCKYTVKAHEVNLKDIWWTCKGYATKGF